MNLEELAKKFKHKYFIHTNKEDRKKEKNRFFISREQSWTFSALIYLGISMVLSVYIGRNIDYILVKYVLAIIALISFIVFMFIAIVYLKYRNEFKFEYKANFNEFPEFPHNLFCIIPYKKLSKIKFSTYYEKTLITSKKDKYLEKFLIDYCKCYPDEFRPINEEMQKIAYFWKILENSNFKILKILNEIQDENLKEIEFNKIFGLESEFNEKFNIEKENFHNTKLSNKEENDRLATLKLQDALKEILK